MPLILHVFLRNAVLFDHLEINCLEAVGRNHNPIAFPFSFSARSTAGDGVSTCRNAQAVGRCPAPKWVKCLKSSTSLRKQLVQLRTPPARALKNALMAYQLQGYSEEAATTILRASMPESQTRRLGRRAFLFDLLSRMR